MHSHISNSQPHLRGTLLTPVKPDPKSTINQKKFLADANKKLNTPKTSMFASLSRRSSRVQNSKAYVCSSCLCRAYPQHSVLPSYLSNVKPTGSDSKTLSTTARRFEAEDKQEELSTAARPVDGATRIRIARGNVPRLGRAKLRKAARAKSISADKGTLRGLRSALLAEDSVVRSTLTNDVERKSNAAKRLKGEETSDKTQKLLRG